MSKNEHSRGDYYPHIDGIRALAVLPVVFFHIWASLCPGGFAGVDVFFVISGYLIVGGILRDLQKDRFTIRGFYHRRIRRIIPANFALMIGVFVAGCALYYCVPLKRLADATVLSTLFSANFYFWAQGGGYFSPDIHQNPLLHLWSLGVEEQFYLFIPMICALVWKYRPRWVAPALGIIGGLSLGGAIWATLAGKEASAFYLIHYRAWELAAGGLLAMLPALRPSPAEGKPGERKLPPWLPAVVGLAMVLVPYVFFSPKTLWPGAAALPSVVGTALLIRYGQTSWISALLSWRPFVATGKISYSLYLWHWPVTVFWRYVTYDQLVFWDYAGMFVLSFVLAWLSWRFVEMPVRASQAWTMRRSFAFAGTGIGVIVSVGLVCVFGRGWPTVLHAAANARAPRIAADDPSFVERKFLGAMTVDLDRWNFEYGVSGMHSLGAAGEPELFLLGDSQSGALRCGLDVCLSERGLSGTSISRSATHMFNLANNKCQRALEELKQHPSATKVLLVQYWSHDGPPLKGYLPRSAMFPALEEFANRLRAMGKTLYVATGCPIFSRTDAKDEMFRVSMIPPRHMEPGWSGVLSAAEYDAEQGQINRELEAICRRTGAVLVPLHMAFREGDGYVCFNGNGAPLYRDGDHFTPAGALRAARFLMPLIFPGSDANRAVPAPSRGHRSHPDRL